MNVYRHYIIVDYNRVGIDAMFLMSFRTTITTNGVTRLLGVKIEAKKGKECDDFTFYATPESYPDLDSFRYSTDLNSFRYSTINQKIKFAKDVYDEMYIGKYDIYDDAPKLLFEVGD